VTEKDTISKDAYQIHVSGVQSALARARMRPIIASPQMADRAAIVNAVASVREGVFSK
jgi:hypothetical protein